MRSLREREGRESETDAWGIKEVGGSIGMARHALECLTLLKCFGIRYKILKFNIVPP